MPSVEYDLGYLKSALNVFESYLLSNDVYWPVGAKPPAGELSYPQLTLGGILLAQSRLNARHLPLDLEEERIQLENEFITLYNRWRVAWESKASKEFPARLNLWRDYLEEYRAHPDNHDDRYAYEVTRRVMLELLSPYAVLIAQAQKDLLFALDHLLRQVFVSGEFVWGEDLKSGFNINTYWYLFGGLRSN